jgi:hypothetical protein
MSYRSSRSLAAAWVVAGVLLGASGCRTGDDVQSGAKGASPTPGPAASASRSAAKESRSAALIGDQAPKKNSPSMHAAKQNRLSRERRRSARLSSRSRRCAESSQPMQNSAFLRIEGMLSTAANAHGARLARLVPTRWSTWWSRTPSSTAPCAASRSQRTRT